MFMDTVRDVVAGLEAEITDILSGGALSMSISGGAEAYYLMGLPINRKAITPYAMAKAAAYRTLLEQGGSLVNGEFKPWMDTHYTTTVETLGDIVARGKQEGMTIDQVEKMLIEEFDYEERYARLAAYQESKRMYREAEQDRFKEEGVMLGRWHHMDPQENPREEHQARDGEVYSLDDPIWNDLEDFNCHCWMEPITEGTTIDI